MTPLVSRSGALLWCGTMFLAHSLLAAVATDTHERYTDRAARASLVVGVGIVLTALMFRRSAREPGMWVLGLLFAAGGVGFALVYGSW